MVYKALKQNFTTNAIKLIDVLCKRTWLQRQEIGKVFKIAYSKDMHQKIVEETSGNFRKLLVALLKKTPAHYEAESLRRSIDGLGTDERLLIDIVCTKSNAEMIELRNAYKSCNHRSKQSNLVKILGAIF